MMTAENDYFVTWMVYLAASVGGLVVLWRLCRMIPYVEVRRVIMLCAMAILWTPTKLDDVDNHWAPAFMAVLMEAISNGSDAAIGRSWPILLTMVLLLSLSVGGRIFWRKYILKRPRY